jgi:hypothetical protein
MEDSSFPRTDNWTFVESGKKLLKNRHSQVDEGPAGIRTLMNLSHLSS